MLKQIINCVIQTTTGTCNFNADYANLPIILQVRSLSLSLPNSDAAAAAPAVSMRYDNLQARLGISHGRTDIVRVKFYLPGLK